MKAHELVHGDNNSLTTGIPKPSLRWCILAIKSESSQCVVLGAGNGRIRIEEFFVLLLEQRCHYFELPNAAFAIINYSESIRIQISHDSFVEEVKFIEWVV